MPRTTHVQDVFDVLYRERWAETVARARKILRGRSDPADVAATAFTRLWAELTSGREGVPLERLRSLTDTLAHAEEQRSRREWERVGYVLDDSVEGAPTMAVIISGTHAASLAMLTVSSPDYDTLQFRAAHDDAVRALSPKQRDAYILTELRGLSTVEAASVLDVSQQAVSKRRTRALAALATHIEEGV